MAAEWAGFETVLQVESDEYCRRVLAKHWPDVPRITDVREVHADERWIRPTVVSGGVPCQPASAAGKRGGDKDDRWLWPEFMRIVRELRPRYAVAENVSGLLSLNDGVAFENLLLEMESAGYEVLPLHYPAAGVGAPHRRDRVFIVAHAECERIRDESEPVAGGGNKTVVADDGAAWDVADADLDRQPQRRLSVRPGRQEQAEAVAEGGREDVADATQQLPHGTGDTRRWRGEHTDGSWWEFEPDVGRVAARVPGRVDRLRALGNAVVPQQAYPIFAAIAEAERRQ